MPDSSRSRPASFRAMPESVAEFPSVPAARGRWLDWVAVAVSTGSLAGLAGRWHWLCDLTTHFRWYWLLLSLAGLTACLRWRRAVPVALFAIAAAFNARDLLPYWLPSSRAPSTVGADAGGDRRLFVISANVHRVNRATDRATTYLRDRRPDVAVVLEVNEAWSAAMEGLADVFPHRVVRPRPDNFGIAVLSRRPLADVEERAFCETGYPSILATIRHPAGDVRLIATHPFPPFNAACTARLVRHLDGVAEAVRTSPLPCIVAGDLNATPWSRPFRRLMATGLVDSAVTHGVQPTWHAGLPAPRIPIDHILVPADALVLRRDVGPDIGSDHLPVEAEIVVR